MNVLSLFDGMSCGRIALDRAGIDVNNYYASELDKYAIKVTQANWPETIQLGDVTKWREWDIDWTSIDLLIGGSPCQGFSFAGKQLAFDDPRSKLFFVYVDILNYIKSVNPSVKFMLENVKMKKEFLSVISEHLGVEPVFINSSLVSAQNRQRYYWANWDFEQPEDRDLVLADILECDHVDREKAHCLDANYYKGGNLKSYFEKNRRQLVFKNPELIVGAARRSRGDEIRKDEKSNALLAGGHQSRWLASAGEMYRKLTPIECERLQTVPDNYTNHVSNTQRYKMLGNGWTVDVIAHIFKSMLGNCAKQVVKASLVAADGSVFYGENSCVNPQKTCPRDLKGFNSGEGYELCKEICKQTNHAEVNAIKAAGVKAKGSVIYLDGHSYACENCKSTAKKAGVKEILINQK